MIANDLTGVGVVFQSSQHGELFVNTIMSGGSADRDGRIQVGDVLYAVNGRFVVMQPLNVVRDLLAGEEGAEVSLTFLRPIGKLWYQAKEIRYSKIDVTLIRGSPDFLIFLDNFKRNEKQIVELNDQIRVVLQEEQNVSFELSFIKQALETEKCRLDDQELTIQREKEKHQMQVEALIAACKKENATCRGVKIMSDQIRFNIDAARKELDSWTDKERSRMDHIESLERDQRALIIMLERRLAQEKEMRQKEQLGRLNAQRDVERARAELLVLSRESRVEEERDRRLGAALGALRDQLAAWRSAVEGNIQHRDCLSETTKAWRSELAWAAARRRPRDAESPFSAAVSFIGADEEVSFDSNRAFSRASTMPTQYVLA